MTPPLWEMSHTLPLFRFDSFPKGLPPSHLQLWGFASAACSCSLRFVFVSLHLSETNTFLCGIRTPFCVGYEHLSGLSRLRLDIVATTTQTLCCCCSSQHQAENRKNSSTTIKFRPNFFWGGEGDIRPKSFWVKNLFDPKKIWLK